MAETNIKNTASSDLNDSVSTQKEEQLDLVKVDSDKGKRKNKKAKRGRPPIVRRGRPPKNSAKARKIAKERALQQKTINQDEPKNGEKVVVHKNALYKDDVNFNDDLRLHYINNSKPKVELVAALSYILFFLPFIWFKDEKFAKYHSNQGLLLLLFAIVTYGVSTALYFIWLPLGMIFLPLTFIFNIIFLNIGIYNACYGRADPLPFIGRFKIIDWEKNTHN